MREKIRTILEDLIKQNGAELIKDRLNHHSLEEAEYKLNELVLKVEVESFLKGMKKSAKNTN